MIILVRDQPVPKNSRFRTLGHEKPPDRDRLWIPYDNWLPKDLVRLRRGRLLAVSQPDKTNIQLLRSKIIDLRPRYHLTQVQLNIGVGRQKSRRILGRTSVKGIEPVKPISNLPASLHPARRVTDIAWSTFSSKTYARRRICQPDSASRTLPRARQKSRTAGEFSKALMDWLRRSWETCGV